MFQAVLAGSASPGLEQVEVVHRPALVATALDALEADGFVLGAPANLGMVAGALKHFLDTIYYQCLVTTLGRPVGVYLHGNDDLTGAQAGLDRILTGLAWRVVHQPVHVTGGPLATDLDACRELGATVAANLTN